MKGQLKNKLLLFLGHPVVAGAVKTIPFGIGSLAANILDNLNGSKPGEVDGRTILPIIAKLAFYAIIVLAIAKGWITAEDAEIIKGQIN